MVLPRKVKISRTMVNTVITHVVWKNIVATLVNIFSLNLGGLREAFRAYSFYVAANGAEPQLPGSKANTFEIYQT